MSDAGHAADAPAAQPVLSKNAVFATWLLVQLALLPPRLAL